MGLISFSSNEIKHSFQSLVVLSLHDVRLDFCNCPFLSFHPYFNLYNCAISLVKWMDKFLYLIPTHLATYNLLDFHVK